MTGAALRGPAPRALSCARVHTPHHVGIPLIRRRLAPGVNDMRIDPAAVIAPGDALSVRSGVELRMKNQFVIFKQARQLRRGGFFACVCRPLPLRSQPGRRVRSNSALLPHSSAAAGALEGREAACARGGRVRKHRRQDDEADAVSSRPRHEVDDAAAAGGAGSRRTEHVKKRTVRRQQEDDKLSLLVARLLRRRCLNAETYCRPPTSPTGPSAAPRRSSPAPQPSP